MPQRLKRTVAEISQRRFLIGEEILVHRGDVVGSRTGRQKRHVELAFRKTLSAGACLNLLEFFLKHRAEQLFRNLAAVGQIDQPVGAGHPSPVRRHQGLSRGDQQRPL